ncbi:MAG TPA: FtsX-like permease family protein [Streptosporangiaceae bacterium]|nr:FtsX-like permease family protein [Streptosporangiaceae bacterium]
MSIEGGACERSLDAASHGGQEQVAGMAGPGPDYRLGRRGRYSCRSGRTAHRDGLPRFVQAQNGYDLFIRGFPESNPERALARIAALPEVAQWARIDIVAGSAILPSGRPVLGPELMATADLTGRAGVELNRFKVISGRMQNPRVPGEAVVDFSTADREGLSVGSVVRFGLGNPAAPRKFAAVRIVGIVASPGQFPAVGASSAFGRIYVTPAFVRSNGITPTPDAAALLIRLRHGATDPDAFLRHLRAAGLDGLDIPLVQQTQTAGVQRSIRVESQALWVLCGLVALAALAILGQALGRQTYLDSADLPTLSALGMSRPQQAWLGIARAGVIGVAAACVVVPVAVLLSPLTPIGLARIAEPDPGFAADAVPLILGAVSAAVLTAVAAAIPARTATMRTRSRNEYGKPLSALSGVLSPAWRSPAAAAGIRMALRPGRGRNALLATGTLAHMLVTFTRRRRHDLAMLKTLGFTRRQVRHAVAWQATAIAAIALLTGVPTGIAGGRWAWHVFAAQLGVLPEPVIPLATIFIAIPSALALANLVAALPARAAARTRPARVLRSE